MLNQHLKYALQLIIFKMKTVIQGWQIQVSQIKNALLIDMCVYFVYHHKMNWHHLHFEGDTEYIMSDHVTQTMKIYYFARLQ